MLTTHIYSLRCRKVSTHFFQCGRDSIKGNFIYSHALLHITWFWIASPENVGWIPESSQNYAKQKCCATRLLWGYKLIPNSAYQKLFGKKHASPFVLLATPHRINFTPCQHNILQLFQQTKRVYIYTGLWQSMEFIFNWTIPRDGKMWITAIDVSNI